MARHGGGTGQAGRLFTGDVPTMPEGYYSGDQPNPNLRSFVERHVRERPFDPDTDSYDVPAFDRAIETTKATAIYNMHTYWSKKPHDAIREYIRHYTRTGDLVLDPFCGSGGTALAALMEGRSAIAIDRSPAATFITRNYCTPVDVGALRDAFEKLKRKVKPEMDWLYGTRCERCGGAATTKYTVYSQVFECPRCAPERVTLFDCPEVVIRAPAGRSAEAKQKTIRVCPRCHERGIAEEISTRSERFGAVPVLVSYECLSGCKPKSGQRRHNDPDATKRRFFEECDLEKLREIDKRELPHWYPPHRMMNVEDDTSPWGAEWREGRNFRTVAGLFTKRNLWALAALLAEARAASCSDELLFVFQSNVLSGTTMQQYREAGGGFAKGTYYVPQVFIEREQLGCMARKVDDFAAAQCSITAALTCPDVMVSTQSSTSLPGVPSSSIDFIFTDPPYAGKVQYGELNFVWEAWLGFDTQWHDEEIIVNSVRGKTEADWRAMMLQAMGECFRVLKPGRWLSLCYHDTSEGTWALVQDLMAEAGFVVDRSDEVLFIDAGQKSSNQITADKVNKRDLVVNFRKPPVGQLWLGLEFPTERQSFTERAHGVIRDRLSSTPGATKDRVYDELVSRMVRAGSMEPHDFDELLRQVAEPVRTDGELQDRWFLRETELAIEDAAESAKENSAGASLRACIAAHQGRNAGVEGVHYSDLFEHYVYAVKDKPRRLLAEWLPDYFYKTEEGTWRLPASAEEEQLKASARAGGLSRRIKRYLAFLEQGVAVPEKERPSDATLAEWIRHSKRAGIYEQGRALYEKGGLNLDGISEEAMVNVEEDYQVCVRMLGRAAQSEARAPKRRGKAKAGQGELLL